MEMSKATQRSVARASTEFVGTLFLCLTVAMTGGTLIAPLAIGCALMVVVYAGGHISGGHYNPAVTLAVLLRGGGKIKTGEACIYVVCQLAGALCGAMLSWALIGWSLAAYPTPALGANPFAACLCELMVTFALCSVVLHTTTTKAQADNSYYGLAIGFTVLSGAVAVGGISGGAFNPAVGFMPVLYGAHSASHSWVYWLGPLLGGALAGAAFRAMALEEYGGSPNEAMVKCAPRLVETIGTMMLCFVVGTASLAQSFLAPLAIGSMLLAMICMGGAISGAHFNPAFTLAALLRTELGATHKRFTWQQGAEYLLAQIVGAALGALAAWGALETNRRVQYPTVPPTSGLGAGFLGELVGTFLLVYVFLNVATTKDLAGNSFSGLAIGMVVTLMIACMAPVSGGAFNPAVGLVGLFSGAGRVGIGSVWIYWVACPLGAIMATAFFRLQNGEEFGSKGADVLAQAASAASALEQALLPQAGVVE